MRSVSHRSACLLAALAAAALSAPAAASLLFSNPELGGGGSPRWVAAGLLDAGAAPDFAVGNDFGDQIAVLLNRGDGLPASTTLYTSGASPRHVAIADFDGDADLDVIAANQSAGTLTLLENDGTGSFSDATTGATVIPTGFQPTEILFADFTGDTVPDIAVVTWSRVWIHRGLGGGSYDAGTAYGVGGVSIAAADVEGDGDLDVVVAISNATLLLNDGTGVLTSAGVVAAGGFDVEFGDVDGDTDPDLVVADRFANRIAILRNTGGTLGGRVDVAVGEPLSVALEDLDGDGDLDIAAASRRDEVIAVLENDGTGVFSVRDELRVERDPFRVIAGDWDGNGAIDLAVASHFCPISGCNEGSLMLVFADATRRLSSASDTPLPDEPRGLSAGDLDGDFLPDVAVSVPELNYVAVLHNDGDRQLSAADGVPVAPVGIGQPADLALVDLEGDGDLDLVAAASRVGWVSVATNNGAGDLTLGDEFEGPGFRTIDVELDDLGGSTHPDLVVVGTMSSGRGAAASVFLNDGAGGFATIGLETPIADYPNDLALGDVDGDLEVDAVTAHDFGLVQVLSNSGAGALAAPVDLAVSGGPHVVGVALADLDGDLDLDLVLAARGPDGLRTLRNDGSGAFSAWSTHAVGAEPSEVLVADFDADGDRDVAVTNTYPDIAGAENSGNVVLLLNDGAGNLTEEGRFFVGLLLSRFDSYTAFTGDQLAAADVDGDGDLDLVVSHLAGNAVSILENRLVSAEVGSAAVLAGGSLTTDPEADGADFTDPVETAVESPNAGDIEIVERAITTEPPGGWRFFGMEVVITAPAASAVDPIAIAFRIDASRIPAGTAGTAVRVFKDGTLVSACAVAAPTADPDPCVASSSLLPDGDVEIAVRTSTASVWNFGVSRPISLALELLLSTLAGDELLHFRIENWLFELLIDSLGDADEDGAEEMSGSGGSGSAAFEEVVVQAAVLGEVRLRLRDAQLSPFQTTDFTIEEASAQVPNLLEVAPFTAQGGGDMKLLAYLEIELPGLQALVHNEAPIAFEGPIGAWPPLPSDLLAAVQPIELLDEQGQPSGVSILSATLEVPTPPPPPPPHELVPVAVPALGAAGVGLLFLALVVVRGALNVRLSGPR